MSKTTIDISELAKISGLPASTLRYYEEKGLIKSVGRNGLKRVFNRYVIEQLEFVALGQRAGFSLEEIMLMFTVKGEFEVNRAKLSEKADELDRHIKQLTAVRDCLVHAAKCPAPRHIECDTFQRLLKLAGKDEAKKRKT